MWLINLISWILNWLFGYKQPSKVIDLKAELDSMGNVRLTWALPEVTSRQKPILHTEISVKLAPELSWTVQDIVVPTATQEILFANVFPGTKYYQAVIIDEDSTRGVPVETNIAVPFDAPGVVTTLTAVLE